MVCFLVSGVVMPDKVFKMDALRPLIVKGERVGLSPVIKDDLEKFVMWLNDPSVACYLNRRLPLTYEDEVEWFDRMRKDPSNIVLSIIMLDEMKTIGSTGLHKINPYDGNAEFGIFIGEKDLWGKGLGTEATVLMLDYGFNVLNLESIFLRVYEFNLRAIKCYRKVGFKDAGRLRHLRRGSNGYHNMLLMDILRDEFNQLHASRFLRD